ncbi:tripartite tricarboxylate transporter substrate binding protein [Belnapia sp. T6]|uniref:Tripartite tricarboxylate transporter substrate binding protein n=1 Tax=Belnapia mucosa TaxID=2804532 RepID=A0ABS1VB36_9PROT|nr:tripartite tricarboxylate transporter substrate binding protein [Belnapia mucosa]MBL6458890.1 tripartite tricarboxylate transporter substrate binding protein [Belnapia mucosa]
MIRTFRRPLPRRHVLGSVAAGLATLAPGPALQCGAAQAQQAFPSRPIRVVVPVPPGVSTNDLSARAVAEPLREVLGQPLAIENRPGASGILAAEAVARAPADGHTLFFGGIGAIVDAFVLAGRPPLDPFRDFAPIHRLTRDHWVIAAAPTLGANTLAELVALARARPGTLTYASFGVGTAFHLHAARFCHRAGIEALHVPYRDSYAADLMAGRVSFVVQPAAPLQAHIAADRLRGLAVLSEARLGTFPDVPTIGEAGYPDLTFNGGAVFYAPGGTPEWVVGRLNAALNEVARVPAVRQRFAEMGLEALESSPEDAARYIRWTMGVNAEMFAIALGNASR